MHVICLSRATPGHLSTPDQTPIIVVIVRGHVQPVLFWKQKDVGTMYRQKKVLGTTIGNYISRES